MDERRMTADVKLLPLPEGEAIGWAQACSYEQMRTYARACVAHATAARDAEIEALRAEARYALDNAARSLTAARTARDVAEARAKRLAEALRDLLSWFPEKPAPPEWRICAGEQGADDAIEYARAALHPTAAQENDDAT